MAKPSDLIRLPRHAAIIMDGNGRWAKRRALPRIMGHRQGVKAVRSTVRLCRELNIPVLTLYAFSQENWGRPRAEVSALMDLLYDYLKSELDEMLGNQILNLALSYGGRAEIVGTVRRLAHKCLSGTLNPEDIDEAMFASNLDTAGLPDPDLLIRTSGENRLSNFLLFQTAYSEFYITPALWPDFDKEELFKALFEYQKRERRFGLTNEQHSESCIAKGF